MKRIILANLKYADYFLALPLLPAAIFLKLLRRIGLGKLPLCKRVLLKVGVFPIANHYYEPLFDTSLLHKPLSQDRELPGINWSVQEQLSLLKQFTYADELKEIPRNKSSEQTFYLNNGNFEAGDADFLYSIIRHKKPTRLIEIGSGYSTLIAIKAIEKNITTDPGYKCNHICIEPYEMPWLEKSKVKVIRSKVELVDKSVFLELSAGDILFIDSSHVIRPQGDVLFEVLELLPTLARGVIVHVHDIFSPKDYPEEWIKTAVRFWNEQYLIEAFLSNNSNWKIIGALNFLKHNYYNSLRSACPLIDSGSQPSSFYFEKIK